MSRLVWLLPILGLAACDPIWGVGVKLRDPDNRPVETATVAVACSSAFIGQGSMAVHSDHTGVAHVGGMGSQFPRDCDVYIAKPGFRTQRIRYGDICPNGPNNCDRVFEFDLMLEPE